MPRDSRTFRDGSSIELLSKQLTSIYKTSHKSDHNHEIIGICITHLPPASFPLFIA